MINKNFSPMFHSKTPPKKVTKQKVFWRFQGVHKKNIYLKWVNNKFWSVIWFFFSEAYLGQSIHEWTKQIFLKAVFHKIYLVHSWILCFI